MLNSMMDNYLETVEGYIRDEDKLVTYKWLSKELEVHTNVAKQVLEMYWKKHKTEKSLTATILLIGYTQEGEMRVEVVKEENLEEAIKKYSKIISQHVYSLQKVLLDIELLANVGGGDAKFGAIKCTKCSLLSDEELFSRRWGSRAQFDMANSKEPERARNQAFNAPAKNKNTLFNHMKPGTSSNSAGDTQAKDKPEVKDKEEPKDKAEQKKLSPQKNKLVDKKHGAVKKPVQSGAAGFKSLFKNVATTNEKKTVPAKNDNSTKIKSSEATKVEKEEPMDSDEAKKPSNGVAEKVESQKSTSAESSEAFLKSKKDNKSVNQNGNANRKEMQTGRSKKRQRSQETDKKKGKKRKRIITAIDSSDDSAASDTDKDLFEDSPPREPAQIKAKSPSPPLVQNINGKRKVRKAVDKTFQDEDGFLVTKKEYVYESASDDEAPVKVEERKEVKKVSPESTNKAKKSNKQTTLMTFFKKV